MRRRPDAWFQRDEGCQTPFRKPRMPSENSAGSIIEVQYPFWGRHDPLELSNRYLEGMSWARAPHILPQETPSLICNTHIQLLWELVTNCWSGCLVCRVTCEGVHNLSVDHKCRRRSYICPAITKSRAPAVRLAFSLTILAFHTPVRIGPCRCWDDICAILGWVGPRFPINSMHTGGRHCTSQGKSGAPWDKRVFGSR